MAVLPVSVTDRPATQTLPNVSLAMARGVIDYVRERRYDSHDGAVAIRGRLASAETTFDHGGVAVRMVFGESVLAVREILLQRQADEWLVIVTDRDEADLGAGVLAHFVGQQLRSPDPWQSVRQRFGATSIDAQLIASPGHRDVAIGIMESLPTSDWPAAPAGVLTRDHAFGTVAQALLGLPDGALDLLKVLGWTMQPSLTGDIGELRRRGGDQLTDAVLGWVAASVGEASSAVRSLLLAGRPAELVPLGLVVGLLSGERSERAAANVAIARLSHRWSGVSDDAVTSLGSPAFTVTATMLADSSRRDKAERSLTLAETIVGEAQATDLAGSSPLLPEGLKRRFRELAEALESASLSRVEGAWVRLREHFLAESDPLIEAFEGSVRLTRWLATGAEEAAPAGLAALARRHLDADGWVDAAVNDTASGAGDTRLGQSLGHVIQRVQAVRDTHDREFAEALAATGCDTGRTSQALAVDAGPVYPLEKILPDVVLPYARRQPTLLLVLDGLSVAVTVEVLDDLLNRSTPRWAEELLPGHSRRAACLTVLPSITEVSRASLLSGGLVRGQQDAERRGYSALVAAHGVRGSLFHKRDLDTLRPGFSLADSVRVAIDDLEQGLVTCVLNSIDDALDRSDPAGTQWNAETVKHLRPLLERAREAGRTVILTSDHGHIVERRQGTQRNHEGVPGPARHRAVGGPVQSDEVLVRGDRVLAPGNTEVLAVSERLRYGPLKAGYHGGAAPAEVVVPLVALVPIERAQSPEIRLARPPQPRWWDEGMARLEYDSVPDSAVQNEPATLFDEPVEASPAASSLGTAIVASSVYREQRQLAGRIALSDERVATLLDRLSAGSQHRLSAQQAAVALDLALTQLPGAFEQLRKLLNVEGYSVIRREVATGTLLLDIELAREQFEVRP